MATTINRDELRSILRNWIAGSLSSSQVHEWAVARYATHRFEPADAVVNAVLADLDMINLNLRTSEDAPVLLQMLEFPEPDLTQATELLDLHCRSIDMDARKQALRGNPLYKLVCN